MVLEALEQACEELINLVTLGQAKAIEEMYESWLATAGIQQPNILGYLFAGFIVLVRFAVPVVLFYYIIVNKLIKNNIIKIIIMVIFTACYALFYFDPIVIFEKTAITVTNFYYFLKALPTLEYEPFIFTFLTNGLAIFVIRAIVVFLTTWLFFMLLVGMGSIVFWIFTGGRSVWNYTEREFKPFTLQLTIIFLMFYPFLGAFRAFLTVLALVLSGVNIKDALYTIRGFQKVCYNIGEEVRCKWVK